MQRDSIKSASDGRLEQRQRRDSVLARQKARRASALNASRGLAVEQNATDASLTAAAPIEQTIPAAPLVDETAMVDSDSIPMDATTTNLTHTSPNKSRRASAADALMTAEWMVDVPVDLSERWYVAARPAGKRCLVIASGGVTKAHGRSGKPRTFPSNLPNGSRATRSGLQAGCELDCIFRESEQTYYVLDVLCWRGQRLADCTSEFRRYWLVSKLEEARAAEQSSRNPCRFVPLQYQPCTPAAVQHAYAGGGRDDTAAAAAAAMIMDDDLNSADGAAGAESADAWRDGLLLLHAEALYEPGPSPLLLTWSDANCSKRFYEYGSEQMAGALAADPSKASKWRTEEVDAAVSFAELLQSLEQPAAAAAMIS